MIFNDFMSLKSNMWVSEGTVCIKHTFSFILMFKKSKLWRLILICSCGESTGKFLLGSNLVAMCYVAQISLKAKEEEGGGGLESSRSISFVNVGVKTDVSGNSILGWCAE